jgi:hypothetical protein
MGDVYRLRDKTQETQVTCGAVTVNVFSLVSAKIKKLQFMIIL